MKQNTDLMGGQLYPQLDQVVVTTEASQMQRMVAGGLAAAALLLGANVSFGVPSIRSEAVNFQAQNNGLIPEVPRPRTPNIQGAQFAGRSRR